LAATGGATAGAGTGAGVGAGVGAGMAWTSGGTVSWACAAQQTPRRRAASRRVGSVFMVSFVWTIQDASGRIYTPAAKGNTWIIAEDGSAVLRDGVPTLIA